MRVLFVSSGNRDGEPGNVVNNQVQSLLDNHVSIKCFLILGKGLRGYLKNVCPLIGCLKSGNFDIIHSHYAYSALVTTLALFFSKSKPHVVSLMGSDLYKKGLIRLILVLAVKRFWGITIVKSNSMLNKMDLGNSLVIPNGVNVKKIIKLEENLKGISPQKSTFKKKVLFIGDPSRKEKNYMLARHAIQLLSTPVDFQVVFNTSHDEVLKKLLTADVLILTSVREGSPNVIKEAMACNCPAVATEVGDIRWLFGQVEGYYITSFDPSDIAEKLNLAINFSEKYGSTCGRKQIYDLGLDSESIAYRLIKVYEQAQLITKIN